MGTSESKVDFDEQYQKEMKKLVSEINEQTQEMFKKLKDQSGKPEVGSIN